MFPSSIALQEFNHRGLKERMRHLCYYWNGPARHLTVCKLGKGQCNYILLDLLSQQVTQDIFLNKINWPNCPLKVSSIPPTLTHTTLWNTTTCDQKITLQLLSISFLYLFPPLSLISHELISVSILRRFRGCPTVDWMWGRPEREESSESPKGYAMNHCLRDYLVIVSLSRPMISSSDIFPLVPLSIDRLITLIHSLKWWESSDHDVL